MLDHFEYDQNCIDTHSILLEEKFLMLNVKLMI